MQQYKNFFSHLCKKKNGFNGKKRLSRTAFYAVLALVILTLGSCQRQAFLFTSFHEPADEGLRMLYSKDGYHWDSLPGIFLPPSVGKDKIMRDPSMVKGPDGTFHLVWTIAWTGNLGIGHASSKDLIHWSNETVMPVMASEDSTVNIWAPELFYRKDKKDYLIVWASTIPYRFEKGIEEERNNHRLYYTLTKDFKEFSSPKLYYDPGYSSIDATLVQRGEKDYVLVFKDNTRPQRNLRVAFASSPLGPFVNPSAPFTKGNSEGPSVVKVAGEYLIYYDWYNKGIYGAARTKDFIHFEDITSQVSLPKGHKHGTIVPVSTSLLKALIKNKHAARGAK